MLPVANRNNRRYRSKPYQSHARAKLLYRSFVIDSSTYAITLDSYLINRAMFLMALSGIYSTDSTSPRYTNNASIVLINGIPHRL